MAFRGINLEPVHRNVQLYLEQMSYAHSNIRGNLDGQYFNGEKGTTGSRIKRAKIANSRIPWISLRSNAVINYSKSEEEFVIDEENQTSGFETVDTFYNDYQLPYNMLGILAEGGYSNEKEHTHWMEKNARQLWFPGRRNTPPPGLLGLNIDTKGNLGSVKTATVKILCHTTDDLELIEANFMTPGITCFLEWGWGTASPLSLEKYQQCRNLPSLLDNMIVAKQLGLGINEMGMVNEAAALQNTNTSGFDPFKEGVGQYDGMLGVITSFNWNMNPDGSFNVTIKLLSPNSLMMNTQLTTNVLAATKLTHIKKGKMGVNEEKSSMNDCSAIFDYFRNCLVPNSSALANQDLPKDLEKHDNANTKRRVKYSHNVKGDDLIGKTKSFEIGNLEDFNKWFPVKGENAIGVQTSATAHYYGGVNYRARYLYTQRPLLKRGNLWYNKDPMSMREIGYEDGDPAARRELLGLLAFTRSSEKERELFVTWGFVEDYIINNICVPRDKDGEPLFTFSSTHAMSPAEFEAQAGEPLSPEAIDSYMNKAKACPGWNPNLDILRSNMLINSPYIMSFNSDVCWLPEKIDIPQVLAKWLPGDNEDTETLAGYYWELTDKGQRGNRHFYPMRELYPNQFGYPEMGPGALSGQIRQILVNSKFIEQKLNSSRNVEQFVNAVFDEINDSCGSPWDFTIKASPNDSSVLQIVDNNWVNTRARKNILTKAKTLEELQEWAKSEKNKQNTTNKFTPPKNTSWRHRSNEYPPDPPKDNGIHSPGMNSKESMIGRLNTLSNNVYPFSDSKGHLTIAGRGDGNIVRRFTLNSKLPKGMQAMAFMANAKKGGTSSSQTKEESSFSLYDFQMRDSFYTPGMDQKQIEANEKLRQEEEHKRARTWVNNMVAMQNTALEPSSAQSIARQQVASFVFNKEDFNADSMPRLMPIELSIVMDGLAGIHQGNGIKLLDSDLGGILPRRFANRVIFQVTKVQHNITRDDWTTTVKCMMRMYTSPDGSWTDSMLEAYRGIYKRVASIEVGAVTIGNKPGFRDMGSPQMDKDIGISKDEIMAKAAKGEYGHVWYKGSKKKLKNFMWDYDRGTAEGFGYGAYGWNPKQGTKNLETGQEFKANTMYDIQGKPIDDNAEDW